MKNKILILTTIVLILIGITTISQADYFPETMHYKEQNYDGKYTLDFGGTKNNLFGQHIRPVSGKDDCKVTGESLGLHTANSTYADNAAVTRAYLGVWCFSHYDKASQVTDGKVYDKIRFAEDKMIVNQFVPNYKRTEISYNKNSYTKIGYYFAYLLTRINEPLLEKDNWRQACQWMIWDKASYLNNFINEINSKLRVTNGGNKISPSRKEAQQKVDQLIEDATAYQQFMSSYKKPKVITDDGKECKDVGNLKLYGPFQISFSKKVSNNKKFGAISGVKIYFSGDKSTKIGNGWGICNGNGKKMDPYDIEPDKNFYIYLDKKADSYNNLHDKLNKIEVTYTKITCTGDLFLIGEGDAKQNWGVVGESELKHDEVTLTLNFKNSASIKFSKVDASSNKELGMETRFALVSIKDNKVDKYCNIEVNGHKGTFKKLQDTGVGLRFTGNITIVGMPSGKYALYEECPSSAYDKEEWSKYMQENYNSGDLPSTIRDSFYFCKSFTLEDGDEKKTTIKNSGEKERSLSLKKVDAADPDKELDIETRFALVSIKDNAVDSFCNIEVNGQTGTFNKLQETGIGLKFTGHINIIGIPSGTYALYEECPSTGYDKEEWIEYMQSNYNSGSLPAILPGHETFYFCKSFTLVDGVKEDFTIINSGEKEKSLTLKKVDANEPDEPLTVPTTFALIKVNDINRSIESYYKVDEEGNATSNGTNPTTFSFTGQIVISGLPDGTYRLYETKPPTGFESVSWRLALEAEYGVGPGGVNDDWAFCGEYEIPVIDDMPIVVENDRRIYFTW